MPSARQGHRDPGGKLVGAYYSSEEKSSIHYVQITGRYEGTDTQAH